MEPSARARSHAGLPVPVLLGTTVLLFGGGFSITNVALGHTDAAFVTFARSAFGTVLLVPLLPLLGARLPRSLRLWAWAVLLGAANVSMILIGIAEGTARAGPAVASVLANTSPFFAALLGWVLLAETLPPLRVAGLVVGFGGVVMIVLADPGGVGSGGGFWLGSALALAGAAAYAAGSLVVRRMQVADATVDVVGLTGAQFVTGTLLLLPYWLLAGDPGATDWGAGELWWPVLLLGAGPQALAYVAFFRALGRWPAPRVFVWLFLAPVVALAIEAARGNLPRGLALLGCVVVVAGIAVVNLPARRRPARPQEAA